MNTIGGSVPDAEYLVGVNPDAMFSIFYQDGSGKLIFVIEVDDEPKKVYLNPRPTENGRPVDASDETAKTRVSLAIGRVIAYFESQGLSVDID